MELYHASNIEIVQPIIINRFVTLDFGTGFYTTENKQQACEFAKKVFVRRGRKGSPMVNVYEFDVVAARDTLEFLEFPGPNREWLDFIVHNRQYGRDSSCGASVIVGPVANDDVFETVALVEAGQIDADAAIERFKVKDLFNQVLFCDTESLSFLSFKEAFEVEAM